MQTYTQGPYAGKQIMFSGGADRGVEIWNVTNKSAVTLIRRIAYPFVGYCHQSWIAGRKYLYVNDELDEVDFPSQIPKTRTLVFDVSVLETADLVATFTTNKTWIDHNLYWKNDFIFEGNYTTGLNVFDATANPVAPRPAGFLRHLYAQRWSDVQRPLEQLPVLPERHGYRRRHQRWASRWTCPKPRRPTLPSTTWSLSVAGWSVAAQLNSPTRTDSTWWSRKAWSSTPAIYSRLVFEGTCRSASISKLQFNLRHKVNTVGLEQTIEPTTG